MNTASSARLWTRQRQEDGPWRRWGDAGHAGAATHVLQLAGVQAKCFEGHGQACLRLRQALLQLWQLGVPAAERGALLCVASSRGGGLGFNLASLWCALQAPG